MPSTLSGGRPRRGQPSCSAPVSPCCCPGYLALSVVRPLTLVPSTVLIVVGTLLFPAQPWFVGISSLAGVVVSAAGIYYFFEFLGLAELFERHHAARVRRLEGQVQRKGFWVVLAWSAFPFVPTDVICYVAGTLRMNLWVFLSAVALGELPKLVTFYVAMGGWLLAGSVSRVPIAMRVSVGDRDPTFTTDC